MSSTNNILKGKKFRLHRGILHCSLDHVQTSNVVCNIPKGLLLIIALNMV